MRLCSNFDNMMEWLARVYVNALNIIHYMHDKYAYEALEMALHDKEILPNHGLRYSGAVCCSRFLERNKIRQGKAHPQ
jgi:formate C-acetyltransferase